MVQMPSSVHCMPLPDRPGALNRISTFAMRDGHPFFGVGGVAPCCAHAGSAASTAPPAAATAAAFRKSLRLIVVILVSFLGLSWGPTPTTCHLVLAATQTRTRRKFATSLCLVSDYQLMRPTSWPLRCGPKVDPVSMRPKPAVGTPSALRVCVSSGLTALG